MKATQLWVVLVALLLLIGCGKSHDPITSGVEGDAMSSTTPQSSHSGTGNRVIWGLWKINISTDRSTVEVVPDRTGAIHFNLVRLLEVDPCADCLRFSNVQLFPDGELSVDLTVRHPFPGHLQLTGFDMRGVIISGTGYTFPVSGRSIAQGDDILTVLNSDGYTHLFNPTDFPPTIPPILGYIPGHMAPGGDLSATLNPFFAYEQDQPRRMFLPGTVSTRTIRVHIPDGPLEFGYAVDVSWFPADGEVTDPEKDFPPEANAMEAYRISVEVGHGSITWICEEAEVRVEVFDHQGLETIESVTVEAPDLFTGEVFLDYSGATGDESWLFTGTILNEIGVGYDDCPLLVRVKDINADPIHGEVDAWQIVNVPGEPSKNGWARTWGGQLGDGSYGVINDSSGNIYVVGGFKDIVDFDPCSGTDYHSSNGDYDIYMSKFDSSGKLLWARTWGGPGLDNANSVCIDGSENVYVAGSFRETVDFDPSEGIDSRTSNGKADAFLSKFDSSGNFEWVLTWGGIDSESVYGIDIDNLSNLYVTGMYHGPVDFDPGPGTDQHTTENLGTGIYLSKFDVSGSFEWARTWSNGGAGRDVAVDDSGNTYVTGWFTDISETDFDPGPGIDLHETNGSFDCFLSKFDTSGEFQWARTWGGITPDLGVGVVVTDSGLVYVVGTYSWLVDFDPGDGVDEHLPNGGHDVFMSIFDSIGDFQRVLLWGGPLGDWVDGVDRGYGITLDDSGSFFVTGAFGDIVDFNPGSGTDEYYSNGDRDCFVSSFDPDEEYQWARTWGGIGEDMGFQVSCDSSGNVYVAGRFEETVDFWHGPYEDNHTSNGFTDAFLIKLPPDGNW